MNELIWLYWVAKTVVAVLWGMFSPLLLLWLLALWAGTLCIEYRKNGTRMP